MQRREEEGRGKERRKALLEKEERKWKEIEASLISSIPNAGSREAAAMAAAVRAVGGDAVLDDSFARERVSSIARRIRTAQLARRALQVEFFLVILWCLDSCQITTYIDLFPCPALEVVYIGFPKFLYKPYPHFFSSRM